jgi:23S rRNA pseudouridine1911/1915/1917 synthase
VPHYALGSGPGCQGRGRRIQRRRRLDIEPSPAPQDEPSLIEISASAGVGQRVDRFLAEALAGRVPGLSRTRLQQWLALGAVSCAQRALAPSTRLAGFETLQIRVLPREADQAFKPDPVPLVIVHEDEDVLVIDNQAGLGVHPAARHWRGTLLNGLLHHRPAALLPGHRPSPRQRTPRA